MAPTVILIRHAQAEHNVAHNLHDPPLTSLGFNQQCQALSSHLRNNLPLAHEISLIVVSPMRRTLQTATQSLSWLMQKGVPVILRAEWQENSARPCDTGTPIAEMGKEWPQFDWDSVDPAYPSKEGLYSYSREGLKRRGEEARRWLRERPEKVIAVVSHSGFLRAGVSGRMYDNADFRVFEFGEGVELVEWELTEKNGGGLGKSEKGVFRMGPGDYPREEEAVKEVTGEACKEAPSESL